MFSRILPTQRIVAALDGFGKASIWLSLHRLWALFASALLVVAVNVVAPSGSAVASETNPMILAVNVTSENQVFGLMLGGASDDTNRRVCVGIDWGDGSPREEVTTLGVKTHTYATPGLKTVNVYPGVGCDPALPYLSHFGIGNATSATDAAYRSMITEVVSFGDLGIVSLRDAFRQSTAALTVPSTIPSTVTSLEGAFLGATNFNQDLSGWLPENNNVTQIHEMFEGATSFNGDITGWDTSGVTLMDEVFRGATSFNRDISSWNVSSATAMELMFFGASSFDQNIGNWTMSSIASKDRLLNFVSGSGLSRSNYSSLLISLAAQTSLPSAVTLGSGLPSYTCASAPARAALVAKSWVITDGGLYLDAPTVTSVSVSGSSLDVAFTMPGCSSDVTNFEYSLDGGSSWTALSPVQTTSPLTISNIPAGVEHDVSIRARSSISGAASAATSATAVPTVSSLAPSSGRDTGGTFVTVTGTGFADADGDSLISSVTVGGQVATSIDNVTATSFTMVTPPGTGSAAVVVNTAPGGFSNSVSFTFGDASEFPVIDSLSVTSGTVRGGTQVVITGSNFQATGNRVFVGSEVITPTAQTSTSITFSTPTRSNANDLTVGPQAVRVETPIDPDAESLVYRSSGEEVYFSFVPTLEDPTVRDYIKPPARVVLGALADRSQAKPLTRDGSTMSGYVGARANPNTAAEYQRLGRATYSYQTNGSYSNSFQLRESTEVSTFSSGPTTTARLDNARGEWVLTSNADCTHDNSTLNSYCSFFGPELFSEPFYATQGQSIAFTWRAQGGGDDYEVYAFLVQVADTSSYDGTHTNILYSRGSTTVDTTSAADIPANGLYRFRFVNGTYDASGGKALGAQMFVKTGVVLGRSNTISFPSIEDRQPADPNPFTVSLSANSGAQVTLTASGACQAANAQHVGSVTTWTITRSSLNNNSCSLTASQGAIGLYAPAASVTRSFVYPALSGPNAPTNITATPGDGLATVTFTAPNNDGGSVITNYEYQLDGGSWVTLNPTSTATTIQITGLTNGVSYSIKVRAINAVDDGTESAAVTVTPAPPPPPAAAPPRIVQQTVAPLGLQRPRQLTLPPQQPVQSPVLQNNQPPQPPVNPQALVNGVPTQVSTVVPNPNNLNIRTGVLNIAVNVQTNEGLVRQGTNGETEVQVRKGGVTGFQGTGLAPRSVVQVFMPLQGTNAKELARIPVDEAGTFTGEAVFATSLQEAPLPIGRQVLQMVTVDEQGRQNVVEFTVNIAQPPPAPEQNREEGATPQLLPGQSLATNAGVPEVVQVTALQDEKQTIIEGDGWTMAVDVNNPNANVQETEDGGVLLELVRDEEASVSGSGFMPGTRADVWLFSEPTLLGTVDIDENGEFNGTVSVDGQVVAVGEHTLQLQGVGMDGYVRAANLGVIVNDEEALADGTAEAAGGFLWWWLILVIVAVLVVVGYLWWRRRQGLAS